MQDLEEQLRHEIIRLSMEVQQVCDHDATRLVRLVEEHGAVQAAREVLVGPEHSDGFAPLWEHGRLDLSLEARVLCEPWRGLFDSEELAIARRRLVDVGFFRSADDEEDIARGPQRSSG